MPTDLKNIIHVLGAGGHGLVVVDALQLIGYPSCAILVQDDRQDLNGTKILGCTIETPIQTSTELLGKIHAAVGSSHMRQRLLEDSGIPNDRWLTIAHPRSSVALSASLGSGSLIAAGAVVGPCAYLGNGVIINHGAVVDHDCLVGDYSHIAPSATLGGGVKVGARALIGAGARVLPDVCIGDGAVIGAGAVVLTDVPSDQTWIGIPARHVDRENR